MDHLDRDLSVNDLAGRALMAPRTFARRFRSRTGTSPLQWLLQQRTVLAQRLLETTDLPVEPSPAERLRLAAVTCGSHFQRTLGRRPAATARPSLARRPPSSSGSPPRRGCVPVARTPLREVKFVRARSAYVRRLKATFPPNLVIV